MKERNERREIILDFTGCKYISEVHWKIRDTFLFPSFYGENLDAFWDMGRDYIAGNGEEFVLIKIKGIHSLPKDIREKDIPEIMDVFSDIEKIWGNVEVRIENES